jgi:hypothetical protein
MQEQGIAKHGQKEVEAQKQAHQGIKEEEEEEEEDQQPYILSHRQQSKT